jgi:hypothetical protein
MNKKIVGLILAGVLTLGMVGCSSSNSEKVDSGSATPTKEEKKETPVKETKKEEVVLVDDDLAKIVVNERAIDEFNGGMYKFLIENKSDKKITVQSRDVSIDGVMQEPVFSVDVTPGKKANGDMSFMEIKDLKELKNLEGRLVIYDDSINELKSYDLNVK